MEYMSQEVTMSSWPNFNMVNVELPAVRDTIAEARDRATSVRISGIMQPSVSRASFEPHQLQTEGLGECRVIDKSRLKSDTVGLLSKIKITNLNKCSMNYTM